MKSDKKPFHETIAEKLIQQLREGTAPWQKPWEPGGAGANMPINPTTGNRYRGINALQLMSEGREDQRWLTYKQAAAIDAQVRGGEKGTQIQYWKFTDEQTRTDSAGRPILDPRGEPIKESVKLERPRVFFATVFNAEQIDGMPLPAPRKEKTWNAVERAEQILQASGAIIHNGEQDRAFYRYATDAIHLPGKERFQSAANYYATALHELSHWTGHESRLSRDMKHPFGSEGYAKEELRAEIASMILGDALGIGHAPDQHAAYVGSWIKVLKDDPLEIFRAAADAEKIQDYLLGLDQRQIQEQATTKERVSIVDPAHMPNEPLQQQNMEAGMNAQLQEQAETTLPDRAEAWTLARVAQNAFTRAADSASVPQLLRMENVLNAMMPLSPENPFWQRHAMPQNADDMRERIDSARATVALRMTDAPVAEARLDLLSSLTIGSERAWNTAEFEQRSEEALGFALPLEWNGRVRVEGYGSEIVDGEAVLTAILPKGKKPDAWGVFAQHANGGFAMLSSFSTEQEAEKLAERLNLIDAHSTLSEHAKASKLARINEERVRRDPHSTDEDIAAARETRKDAEFVATISDEDLQRRIALEERAITQNGAAALGGEETAKVLINVPYKQKDEVKALGAKWDRQEQSWFIPTGVDSSRFAKWTQEGTNTATGDAQLSTTAPGSQTKPEASGDRQYLAVAYSERAAAKAAGAVWDKVARSWYAGPDADMARLDQWRPENVSVQQGPAMTPREEFAEALKSVGCVVTGDHPVMDGNTHRIAVEGENFTKNSGSGFYVGHLDGHPAGYTKNNKTGADLTWKSKGYVLDPEQKALMAAEAATRLQQREAGRSKRQEQAAVRVAKQMESLIPVERATPYMQAKGIEPQSGAFTDKDGRKTYLPAIDVTGKQWSIQYIQEDGTKRFAKDGRKEGCFHVVGGMDALASAPAVVIGEGYATAVQLKQVLGYATVCAFDAGNLAIVAQDLHRKFPDKPVVIAADDDRHLEMTQGANPGRTKAEEAARLVGGKVVLPIFAPGENDYPADLENVTPAHYREQQRTGSALSEEQLAALDRMKQFTDFNDLANKSALGHEGINRQLCSFVDDVIEKQALAEAERQQQEAVVAEKPKRRQALKFA